MNNLFIGPHTVTFSSIAGWTCPSPQTVTIQSNKTATATGVYTKLPEGSLKVTISPVAAVKAGAKWQLDGGSWNASGKTVHNLSVGSHTVTFSSITGWTSPAPWTAVIQNNKTIKYTCACTHGP